VPAWDPYYCETGLVIVRSARAYLTMASYGRILLRPAGNK